jgi:L-lactate utilization protein LutB
MDNPITTYWNMRITDTAEALEKNNFEVFTVNTAKEAIPLVVDTILPETKAKTLSWGGSTTFKESGLYDALKDRDDLEILDTYDKNLSKEASYERRRQALMVDIFITGTNAVTLDGTLVNLDMIGNRVGALTFGPRNVIVLAGRNKIVSDLDEAMYRIKNYVAPVNAMRLDKKTPCTKTSFCQDCKSPDRICNTWTITEKAFPPKRIKVVLVNEDLGF